MMEITDPSDNSKNTLPSSTAYRSLSLIALAVLVLDQLSKLWIVFASGLPHGLYPPFGGVEIIEGVFNIVYATNEGAAWGILGGQRFLLIFLAVVAITIIIRYRHELELEKRSNQIAVGLILGGIVGNTLDRLAYGHVVDFLDVHLQFYRWPTFNIADCGIVVGTTIYIFCQLFFSPKTT